jgi:choline dehydrogenase
MAYQRGTKAAHQQWADMVGDSSYAWDQFLPFFEKSLNYTPANDELRGANASVVSDPSVLGTGDGPLSVTYPHYAQAFATWAKHAFMEIGLQVRNGFQSGALLGQSYGLYTINATTMHRDSSETSFLRKGLADPNLTVFQSAMAKRIRFHGKRAVGVDVETSGFPYTLSARKEIVLSAGALQSPQLLMVSGVGPAATLKAHDIPIVADRPGVGQNMQDHIIYAPSYRVNVITQSALLDPVFEAQANRDYNERAAGIYANPTSDILAWEKIPEPKRSAWLSNHTRQVLAEYPDDWPEVEFLSMGGYFGYQKNYIRDNPSDGYQYASLAVSLCTPRSRGNITITSPDAAVPPLINPNWLTDSVDVELAVAAFKRTRDFFNTTAIQPILIGPEYFPGPQVATDEEILDHVRKSFDTIFHASCTCAMGRVNDPQAVVDSKARVIGVDALRVVDASAFPFLPPGHPQSTICKFLPFLIHMFPQTEYLTQTRCIGRKDCVRYLGQLLGSGQWTVQIRGKMKNDTWNIEQSTSKYSIYHSFHTLARADATNTTSLTNTTSIPPTPQVYHPHHKYSPDTTNTINILPTLQVLRIMGPIRAIPHMSSPLVHSDDGTEPHASLHHSICRNRT